MGFCGVDVWVGTVIEWTRVCWDGRCMLGVVLWMKCVSECL